MNILNGIGGISGTSFKLEQKRSDQDAQQNTMSSGHKRKSTVCVMDRTARKGRNPGHGSMPAQNAATGSQAKNGAFAGQAEQADPENYRSVFNKSVPISEGSQNGNDGQRPAQSQSGQQPSTSRIVLQDGNPANSQQLLSPHKYHTQKLGHTEPYLQSTSKHQASQSGFSTFQGSKPQYVQQSPGFNQTASRQFTLTKGGSPPYKE